MKKRKVLYGIFAGLFLLGVFFYVLGRIICFNQVGDYKEIHGEYTMPSSISCVFVDDERQQIFVCYDDDVCCVNAYTFEGEFLWRIQAPLLKGAVFGLDDSEILVGDRTNVYVYSVEDGRYLTEGNIQDLGYEQEKVDEEDVRESLGEFSYSTYNVYKVNEYGETITIVSRPWWHWMFNIDVILLIVFTGVVGMLSVFTSNKRRIYLKIIEKKKELDCERAEYIRAYYDNTAKGQVIYTVLSIALGVLGIGWMVVGIVPLTIHLLVATVILNARRDKIRVTQRDKEILEYCQWKTVVTYLVAFASMIIVSSISQL